jgi:ApbE superfamily uncharacterized protein (UPF0280 family)
MVEASEKAGVGPMAAVAGVIADLAVETLIKQGAKIGVVEDGGETSAISSLPIDIGLLAGNSLLSKKIGFRLETFPIGVATSSGKYSHAFNFGQAEAVTIFAENAGLADAAATAVCNIVKGEDQCAAIKRGLQKAMAIKGVRGAFIIYKDNTGRAGLIPKLINIKND